MLFTSTILIGGAAVLGTKAYRARQTSPTNLVEKLLSKPENNTMKQPPLLPLLKPRTIIISGLATGGALLLIASANGLTPLVLTNQVINFLVTSNYGPLLFITVQTLRLLVFLPDTLMCVAGGVLFGPFWGTIYSLIGEAISAMLGYAMGRYVQTDGRVVDSNIEHESNAKHNLIERYGLKMQEKPFESMILLRGSFLHFDIISYLAGYLNLAWKPYLLGTMLGTSPGTVAAVLFGASFQIQTIHSAPKLNPITLAASGTMMASCLGIAYYRHITSEHPVVDLQHQQPIPMSEQTQPASGPLLSPSGG